MSYQMDEIKRDKCAILSLVLTGKWYDMIEHGGKREEYHAATKYWRTRLHNWDKLFTAHNTPVVEFRRGYAHNAPRMAFWCLGIETVSGMMPYAYVDQSCDKLRHPSWGEPSTPHFFIELGGRVTII